MPDINSIQNKKGHKIVIYNNIAHNPNPIPSINTLELYASIAVHNLYEALVSSGMKETNDYIVSIDRLLEFTMKDLGFARGG